MSKIISFNIETQTEDGRIVSLCHINEKMISLEISSMAEKLFYRNRSLFDTLNGSTQLKSGKIYRLEPTKVMFNYNKLSTKIGESFDFLETEISNFTFEDNFLKRQQRALTKKGKKIDFDPTRVSSENSQGYLDENNLSPDDIQESQIICEIQEIEFLQDKGVKTLLLVDNMVDKKIATEVGYRIELSAMSEIDDFIKFCLDKAKESLYFLENYISSLSDKSIYNKGTDKFNDKYTQEIFSSLNLADEFQNIDTSSNSLKNSEFGMVATSYYNLSKLASDKVDPSIYSRVLRVVLPTNITNEEMILSFYSKFSSLYNTVSLEYGLKDMDKRKATNPKSFINNTNISKGSLVGSTKGLYKIEEDVLGYNIFSETQAGINFFTADQYLKRTNIEKTKYYPNIDGSNLNGLTSLERAEFQSEESAHSYLTPSNLVLGKDRISTNRGLLNIPQDKLRQFRLAKSHRLHQKDVSKSSPRFDGTKIGNDIISSFNFVVSKPNDSLLSRSTSQDIDPLKDAKYYVGEQSYFITDQPELINNENNRAKTREDKRVISIISDVVPHRFLKNRMAARSIKEIQISNPKSRTRTAILNKEIDLKKLPPQIKYMMSDNFATNPNSDPLKNYESRTLIEETQKNIFVIKALVGFEIENGLPNLSNPIIEELNNSIVNSGRPILAKAYDYEVPEIGILKDNFMATIYSNLLYIRG